MRFLLDTNAISEWVKPRPDPGVVRWFDQVDEDRTYLSVITLGEIRKGVERLADGRRRDRLGACGTRIDKKLSMPQRLRWW